jgi:hypothetical protein
MATACLDCFLELNKPAEEVAQGLHHKKKGKGKKGKQNSPKKSQYANRPIQGQLFYSRRISFIFNYNHVPKAFPSI